MDIESARQRTDERTDERTDGRNETKEHRRGTTKFELEGDTWTPLREARCKGKCSLVNSSISMLEKARDALPFAIDLIAARRKNETVPPFDSPRESPGIFRFTNCISSTFVRKLFLQFTRKTR